MKLLVVIGAAALWAPAAPAHSADEGAANIQLAKNWVADIVKDGRFTEHWEAGS